MSSSDRQSQYKAAVITTGGDVHYVGTYTVSASTSKAENDEVGRRVHARLGDDMESVLAVIAFPDIYPGYASIVDCATAAVAVAALSATSSAPRPRTVN